MRHVANELRRIADLVCALYSNQVEMKTVADIRRDVRERLKAGFKEGDRLPNYIIPVGDYRLSLAIEDVEPAHLRRLREQLEPQRVSVLIFGNTAETERTTFHPNDLGLDQAKWNTHDPGGEMGYFDLNKVEDLVDAVSRLS